MTPLRRLLPALVAAALLAGACDAAPGPSATPSGAAPTPLPDRTPAATERPFAAATWPASGSACDTDGYAGLLGRVEAVSARVVRFTLCEADGAFPARLAHPVLGLIDAVDVEAVEADPDVARSVAGAGAFRVDAWTPGDNLRLARVGDAAEESAPADPTSRPDASTSIAPGVPGRSGSPSTPDGVPPPVVVLRWGASPAERGAALRGAEVDGIDAPDPTEAAGMATLPELVVTPRPGLATAYLGFGAGKRFAAAAVRRAFSQAIDAAAVTRAAFPPGSRPATHLAPCEVPGGCEGAPWYEFNGPAAAAALEAAGFDTRAPVTLHVPDSPVPGLPDPAATAAALRDLLAASVGVTVAIETQPAADLAAGIASGDLDGLYLGGVTTSLADATGFLEPLFGREATGTAVGRAKDAATALAGAASETGAARLAAFAALNDAIRSAAPVVPLAHAGDTVAYRADVGGVAVSPLGVDPLGTFVPGDRRQLVVMSAVEPAGTWCAVDPSPDALRLCALVTPGLYAFDGATLGVSPALATRCAPSSGATVWTCRLRSGLRYADGAAVDSADVLAVVRAQADAAGALRAALPATAFAAWDELFAGPTSARP